MVLFGSAFKLDGARPTSTASKGTCTLPARHASYVDGVGGQSFCYPWMFQLFLTTLALPWLRHPQCHTHSTAPKE